jgi:HPr kinase/phosphorylase
MTKPMTLPHPQIFPLEFEASGAHEHPAYQRLFNPDLPFDRFNPLEPQPIGLLDEPLRTAITTRGEPLPDRPLIFILTDCTPEEALDWVRQQPANASTFLHTTQDTQAVSAWLFAERRQQSRQWQHGVFMEVAGSGVLITGESGIGKSELALELLSRGHRLIADDAPYFIRGHQGIEGHCPENIQDLLEVRGLGIINVRSLFGDNALKPHKNLRLLIELYSADHKNIHADDRLHGERGQIMICQEMIPLFRLPIAPGRNIAVFVETVVRQHNLERTGNDSARPGLNPVA